MENTIEVRMSILQTKMEPLPPEVKSAIIRMFQETRAMVQDLYERWLDEEGYEALEDYGKAVQAVLASDSMKPFVPAGFEFVVMTREPFGFRFRIGTREFQYVVEDGVKAVAMMDLKWLIALVKENRDEMAYLGLDTTGIDARLKRLRNQKKREYYGGGR